MAAAMKSMKATFMFAFASPAVAVAIEDGAKGTCMDYLNGIRASEGIFPVDYATDDAYECAYYQSQEDGSNFPSTAHQHFGDCSENGQCQAAGQSDCYSAIDAYYSEGPGGGHHDIMMSTSYCYFAYGECYDCSPYGSMFTHNFYSCHGLSSNVTNMTTKSGPVVRAASASESVVI